jgi:hypothetical protein
LGGCALLPAGPSTRPANAQSLIARHTPMPLNASYMRSVSMLPRNEWPRGHPGTFAGAAAVVIPEIPPGMHPIVVDWRNKDRR